MGKTQQNSYLTVVAGITSGSQPFLTGPRLEEGLAQGHHGECEGAGDLPPGKRVGVRGTEERGFRASGSMPSEGRALWRSLGRQARGFGLWEVRAAPALDTL